MAGLLLAFCEPLAAQGEHVVPLFLSGASEAREGFIRIVNRSGDAGTVTIRGIDDAGWEYGPVEVAVGGTAAVHLNSRDLETGNTAKGLPQGLGSGRGDWLLLLSTALDIQPRSYIRTADGFVAGMQELARGTVANGEHAGFHVPTFNPGSNVRQRSSLRLVNTAYRPVEVVVAGIDDAGASPGGEVRIALGAGRSRRVEAVELENGAPGLEGALGDGRGKWRLLLTAPPEVLVLSLLESPTGHLMNISRGGSADALDVDDPAVADRHRIPLFLSASHGAREGFARIVNHSADAGEVSITATDDSGRRFGPVGLSLGGRAAVHFNSRDLERGNPGKGLPTGVGDGQGDWRLELSTDLPIEAMAFVRTADGFVASMQDLIHDDGDVGFFNPASNDRQRSTLRLTNTLDRAVEIVIEGVDDQGMAGPAGAVRLTLGAGEARTLTARQLEDGGDGLRGRLGDGAGKWRLSVSAPGPASRS